MPKGRLWPLDYTFDTIVEFQGGPPIERDGFVFERRAGDFRFLDENGKPTRDVAAVRRFQFYCPKQERGEKVSYCGEIRVGFHVKPPGARTWAWDGNFENPTLQPSINCLECWHGYVTGGNFKPA